MSAFPELKLDRGLPASVEAERAILGAILIDSVKYFEASEHLHEDHFSLDSHKKIFRCIGNIIEAGKPLDIITLTEELQLQHYLEAVNGVAYIAALTDGVPARSSILHHINIVKEKALLRGLIHASNAAMVRAYEQTDPVLQILGELEEELMRLSDYSARGGLRSIKEIVQKSGLSVDKFFERSQHITGVATRFEKFDSMTSGLQPSDLVIVAARPSMGKTAFAMNIAANAAGHDRKIVAVFSLEMSTMALLNRLVCSEAIVDSHAMRTGFLNREERLKLGRSLAELMDAPIYIDDTAGVSVQEVRAKARRLQRQQGLDLIIVDYLQLMSTTPIGGAKRYENRTQEVSAISRGLKSIAKELNVPLVALSQLSRAPETRGDRGHRPQLADLRESGSIEQDADLVAFIFREEVYMRPEDAEAENVKGIAEIIIGKQRNGPTGTVKLAFLHSSTRFDNLSEDVPM